MSFHKQLDLSTANSDRWFKLTPPQAVNLYKYLTQIFKEIEYDKQWELIHILHDELMAHFEDWDLEFGEEKNEIEERMKKVDRPN